MKIEPLSRFFASFYCKSSVRSFPKDALDSALEANTADAAPFKPE
jgi:hypothetical protein